jgi:hypothetical protein
LIRGLRLEGHGKGKGEGWEGWRQWAQHRGSIESRRGTRQEEWGRSFQQLAHVVGSQS